MVELKIIGFKEVAGKEDNTYYCPLNIDEFIKNNIVYDKKHKIHNTFSAYDSILADSDITSTEKNSLTLDDFNCSDSNITHDDEFFNGFIHAGFICITLDGAIFKNMYLLHLNKLNMVTHHRVRANFVINKHIKDNIYDVML